jgi:hypothetical protein
MLQEQTSNNKPSEEALLYYLVQFGAPLMREFAEAYPVLDKKTVFEGALELVHQDPTLTRCFPLVVEQNRDFFENREELRHLSTTPKTTKTLGFFLELTGELAGAQTLLEEAQALYGTVEKASELEPFFEKKKMSRRARLVAEETTPQAARKWGFLLNIGMDSFASHFRKFSHT